MDIEDIPPEMAEDLRRIERKRTFQLGDAPRLPATKREEAAVARWIEIDQRRYVARTTGEPFSYTQGERQLKQRLLKAGLIIVKPQPKMSRRIKKKMDEEVHLSVARRFAAAGDPGATEYVAAVEKERKQEAWQKKMRMLRRQEPKVLMEALRDVMAERGLQRPLAALWREFIDAWNQAPAQLQRQLEESYGSLLGHILDGRKYNPDVVSSEHCIPRQVHP